MVLPYWRQVTRSSKKSWGLIRARRPSGGGPRVSGGSSRVAGIAKCPIFGRPRPPAPPQLRHMSHFRKRKRRLTTRPPPLGRDFFRASKLRRGGRGSCALAPAPVRRAEFRSDGARASWNDGDKMVIPPVGAAGSHKTATRYRAGGTVAGESRDGGQDGSRPDTWAICAAQSSKSSKSVGRHW